MPIHLKVETEVDDTLAQAATRNIQERFKNAGRDSGVVFGTELSSEMSKHLSSATVQRDLQNSLNTLVKYGDTAGKEFATNMAKQMEIELTNAGRVHGESYGNAFNSALSGVASQFGVVGSKAESAIGKITSGAGLAAIGVAGIGIATVAVGKQFYDLGEQWAEITDKIVARTGIIGDQLKELTDNVANVADKTAASPGQIADVLGQLTASLNLQGPALETITKQITDYDQMNQNAALNIREFGKVMREFQVPTADVGTTLDTLNSVAQKTQIPLNQLVQELYDAGPTADVFGLSISELTNVLGVMEDSGINSEKAVAGLRLSLANLAADKKPLQDAMGGAFAPDEPALNRLKDAIQKVQDFARAGNEIAAIDLGKTVFGKSWVDLGDDILHNKINVETLNTSIKNTGPTIEEQRQATKHWGEDFTILKNQISDALKPLAEDVFGAVDTGMQKFEQGMLVMIGRIKADWVSALGSIFDDSPLGKILGAGPHPSGIPAAPPGQSIPGQYSGQTPTVGGIPIPGLQQPNAVFGPTPPFGPGSLGGGPGAQAERRGAFEPGGGPPSDGGGFGLLPETESGKKGPKGPRLPEAPVLPFGTNLPTDFANLPQTASMFSAETAYLDAQHTLEEKQARLTQLQQTNTATANDIQKARNDITEAERRQQEAELRLYDTRQQLFDKSNKQLNSYLNDMQGISAGLDKDLGLSKGLPGLADNLVRFLATLAAAPLLGQLSASATAQEQNAPGSSGGLFTQLLGRAGLLSDQNTGTTSTGGGGSAILAPGGGVTIAPDASAGAGGGAGGGATITPSAYKGGGAEAWRPQVRAALAQYGAQFGITNTQAWEDAMIRQIATESSGDPNAINRYDSNAKAGHPSQGIAQFIPSTFAANNITGGAYLDPIAQISAMIPYVAKTYGMNAAGGPNMIGMGHGYQHGGEISESGGYVAFPDPAGAHSAPGYMMGPPSRADYQAQLATSSGKFGDPYRYWTSPGNFNPDMAIDSSRISTDAMSKFEIIQSRLGHAGRMGLQGYADAPAYSAVGGSIGGPRGTDNIPAWLTAGEFVVNKDAAAKNMDLLRGINSGKPPHFAVGGLVDIPGAPPPPPPPPPPPVSNNAVPNIAANLPGIWGMVGGLGQSAGAGLEGGIGRSAGEGPKSVQEGAQPSSRSPGGGSSSGGAPVAAASMIADAFAPGSSALIQLATRAIKYAGQAASIGVMGLMETFLPGGTELSDPSKSLIGRVASGIAGGQPASPNQAAKSKPPQAPPLPSMGSPASGRGTGPLPGPPGSDRPSIVIQNQTIQTPDTGAYEREMSRIAASHAAGDNTR